MGVLFPGRLSCRAGARHQPRRRRAARRLRPERTSPSHAVSLPEDSVAAAPPLLAVTDLSVTFSSEAGPVTAVRSLTYQVHPGEVLGIVGESGSGKTVSSLAIMDLLPAHARVTGSVRFRGGELTGRSDKDLSDIRGRKISMIFQDPLSALTPVYTS